MEKITAAQAFDLVGRLRARVGESIFGQTDLIDEVLCALLAGGHILVTGAPGLAKTTLVRAISKQLGLSFGRVQFTPDLLPSDIVGSEILNQDMTTGKRVFEFSPGPIFAHLLLADEINRASPRTQSALLEAMQERAVTVGKKAHMLPLPFMVFATQNPLESEGTFPLPEAQLDRFLLHTLVSYPDSEAEMKMLKEHSHGRLFGEQQSTSAVSPDAPTLSTREVQSMIAAAAAVHVDDEILTAIRDLVRCTRPADELCPEDMRPLIAFGAGPRAGLSLVSCCRAYAMINGAESVRWSHVTRMAKPVLRHRLALSMRAQSQGKTEDDLIGTCLKLVEERLGKLNS